MTSQAQRTSGGEATGSPPHGYEFAVFVIESPRADDAYWHRSEMAALQLVGQLDAIPVAGKFALDRPHVERALAEAVPQFVSGLRRPYVLCLHLGAHGDAAGIELSSGERISWADLRGLLVPVCRLTAGLFLLSMSSCEGLNAQSTAISLLGEEELPFMAMVGSAGKPQWAETAVGYATLYHHLKTGASMPDAVQAMRAASRHPEFDWVRAEAVREEFRRSFQHYLDEFLRQQHAAGEHQAGIGPEGTGERADAPRLGHPLQVW